MASDPEQSALDQLSARVAALESLLARQEVEIASLRAAPALDIAATGSTAEALSAMETPVTSDAGPVEPGADGAAAVSPAVSGTRRAMLLGGLGVAGAAAAVVASATPAAAANGDPVSAGGTTMATSATVVATSGAGITAFAGAQLGTSGSGVVGQTASRNAVDEGVLGFASADAAGVKGDSVAGPGVRAYSGSGPTLLLQSAYGSGPPAPGDNTWGIGSVLATYDGALWYCVEYGDPGTWRQLTGPSAAGAFTSIVPARAYDSRYNSPSGRLAAGSQRVVSVATAYSPDTTSVVNANLVPANATAVMVNLTAVATANTGYLFVAPGTATGVTASSVNWTGTTNVANALTVKLGTSRDLKVFCGTPGASAHFLVDVLGYYV